MNHQVLDIDTFALIHYGTLLSFNADHYYCKATGFIYLVALLDHFTGEPARRHKDIYIYTHIYRELPNSIYKWIYNYCNGEYAMKPSIKSLNRYYIQTSIST